MHNSIHTTLQRQSRKNNSLLVIGIALLLCSLAVLFCVGMPTMQGERISFSVDETSLHATYYSVEGSQQAVLLCGGFSSDQQMLRPLANLFVKSGISAMTFDYSGHGRSFGTVGFDNATNGQIAKEISSAMEKLCDLSKLEEPSKNLIMVGHSMGGRSILELFSGKTKPSCKEIILLSPQINYDNNTQSTAFTGVNDAEVEPWKSLCANDLMNIPVTLIGSGSDDIVSTQSMTEIYNRISDRGAQKNVSLTMVDGVLHSYMPYSTQVAKGIFEHLGMPDTSAFPLAMTYGAVLVSAIALFMILCVVNTKLENQSETQSIVLVNYKKFIIRKIMIFIPSLIVMVMIACLAVFIPFGAPIMSISFIGGIAGYGIISLLTYHFGKMAGVKGRLALRCKIKHKRNLWIVIAVLVIALLLFDFILGSCLYGLLPLNMRLFWLVVAGAVMSIGFYVGNFESDMLKNSGASLRQVFGYNVVQYLLLFLMAIGYIAIGSYSGLVGLLQNLILMYVCIFIGNIISKLTNTLVGSLATGFLFQATILTSTCLMVVF